ATKAAQISNLLYRRSPIGRPFLCRMLLDLLGARRLKTCDTADWKSALRMLAAPTQRPYLLGSRRGGSRLRDEDLLANSKSVPVYALVGLLDLLLGNVNSLCAQHGDN